MRLGYTIVYVPDVPAALDFYVRAFGMEIGFLHESGQFGTLATGETTLAFTSHELGAEAVPPYTPLDPDQPPAGFEVTLISDDVDGSFRRAVDAGARPLTEPHDEPWGQRASYVRDPFGTLVGIASPMST
ncbi:MAG: VOC family protein [Micrococcales bacterium]|nr:VOC family protein [Micrococcales bacterium]